MPDPDPSSLPSPSTREEANYSREEFERDRFGQTGDDLAAPCGPQKPTAEAARSASPRRLEALALDAVAQIIRYVPDVEHPESYASIEVFLETSGLRQWVQIINGDRVCIDEMHADIGQAIEEGLLVALEEASSLRLQAGMDDVSPAGSPSNLATIESLKSELTTLRSTHATLQRALRQYGQHQKGCGMCPSTVKYGVTFCEGESCTCGWDLALNGAPGTE